MARAHIPNLDPISRFVGSKNFLSNFYRVSIKFGQAAYPSVEHAFQAAKTLDPTERAQIKHLPEPADARKYGRSKQITLREDWEEVKDDMMYMLVRQKFDPCYYPRMAWKLVDTAPRKLYEGNTWGDRYWGCDPVTFEGQNKLGVLLMEIRTEITPLIQIADPRKLPPLPQ